MRLPRVRFSVRTTMVAVALITIGFAVLKRPHPVGGWSFFGLGAVYWSNGTTTKGAITVPTGYRSFGPFLAVKWSDGARSLYIAQSAHTSRSYARDQAQMGAETLRNGGSEARRFVAEWMAADAELLDPDLVVPALATAMNDPQPETRRSVLLALSMFTTKSVPAVLATAGAVDDSDVLVRISATYYLWHTRRDTEEASAAVTSALVRALKDQNRVVRISAAKSLAGIGAGERAVPAMVELLQEHSAEQSQHDRNFQRREAVEILESIGLGARGAVPALVSAMRDDDAQVRVGAAASLVAVGESKLALPVLREMSDEGNADMTTKSIATRALQKIAPLPEPDETQPLSPEP